MKKFKSLASTHIRKIAILLVISTLSSTILCSCGDDKNSTQIETMIEEETEETTTQKPDEAKDEKTERQSQDADSTEDTAQETAQHSTQSSTTQSTKPTTEQGHVHNYKSETYYTTETQTVHHDAVTHQETVTTYTDETTTVHHDGSFTCRGCGATFTTGAAAAAHCDNGSDACYGGGYYGSDGWDETVTTQVPHTETITVTDSPAYDEKVEVQVPHTRNVCSCGATK